jgi:hypothetical protein
VETYQQNLDTAKEYLAKVTGEIPTLRLAYTANNVQLGDPGDGHPAET